MVELIRNRNTVIVYDDYNFTGIILATCKKTEWEDIYAGIREFNPKMHPCTHIEFLVLDPMYVGNYRPVEKFLNGRDSKILESDEVAKELYKFFYDNAVIKNGLKGADYTFIGWIKKEKSSTNN